MMKKTYIQSRVNQAGMIERHTENIENILYIGYIVLVKSSMDTKIVCNIE